MRNRFLISLFTLVFVALPDIGEAQTQKLESCKPVSERTGPEGLLDTRQQTSGQASKPAGVLDVGCLP